MGKRSRSARAAGTGVPLASAPVNSLRMDEAELDAFLAKREAGDQGVSDEILRRQHLRWPYRVAAVRVEFAHPGGSEASVVLACRNLSAGGVALLHRSYVHAGTRCRVWLVDAGGHEVGVPGVVLRTVLMDGSVHEVGVKFDAPLEAREFVKPGPFEDVFTAEKVDPESLEGTVLCVEDSKLDQALIRHFLRETKIILHMATTMDEAMAKAKDAIDLIICDFDLGESTGADLVARLKREGISVPMIMMAADTSQVARQLMSEVHVDGIVPKPLKPSTLYRVIGEFLAPAGGAATGTTLSAGHPNQAMLPTFVQQVRDYAVYLEKAVEANSAARCRSLCVQIAGAAPVMGFEKLAETARAGERALAGSGSVAESAGALRVLMRACRQVSARGPE